ncbi:MAG: histidinol-phosphate transaminase [Desulfatiglandales bacterium]
MLSEKLKKLRPYVPGEQPQDRAYLKLNTNENPYAPSPRIRTFLQDFDVGDLRLYPDPLLGGLREKIALRYGIDRDQVFVGNGSDEVLSFAFYACFDGIRGPLLFPEFTYTFYPVYCDFYGITYKKIPLEPDFSIDTRRFLETPNSCGLVFANPNAPTGINLPLDKIAHLLENYPRDNVVLIDEAYVDFGAESAIRMIKDFENLLITRTMSKGMSLAGLRLGFAMGSPALIKALFTVKDSFNSYTADSLSLKIGEIAIGDEDYYRGITEKIIAAREYLSSELQSSGWRVLPSMTNFIFASKEGIPGQTVYSRLKKEGILVRHFDIEGIKDFVRITIGKQADMERFVQVVTCLF